MVKRIKISIYCIFILLTVTILFAQDEKCGTFRNVERHWKNKLTKTARSLVSRPVLQKSILTANKKIRIHYDTSGINQPAMVDSIGKRIPNSYHLFVDTLVNILDSVWSAEIDAYGFVEPPADNGRGGGDEYDFYIYDLFGGTFGQTQIEDDLPFGPKKINQQYASFIEMDNDFGIGYRTKGVPAIMATTTHEFHHAIQVGGSGVWDDKYFYFYELCAESMENMVFEDAKDYIFDISKYFSNISKIPLFQQNLSFDDNTIDTPGYERALWGMFLMKKYGTVIMKVIWDEMKQTTPVQASQNALNSFSSSLEREFTDFTFWNFYTGFRADTGKYYSDAMLFPMVSQSLPINVATAKKDFPFTSKSFTSTYIKAVTNNDSAFVMVCNTNFNDALNYTQQTFPFVLSFSSSSSSGLPAISKSIYAKLLVDDYSAWSYTAIGSTRGPICFPNPFNPKSSSLLIALQGLQIYDHPVLKIYSASSMDLVYSGTPHFKLFSGTQYAEWNGKDNNGQIASSGVYLFILENGTVFNKGKFAIIR